MSLYNQWSAKTEVLEVHTMGSVKPGRHCGTHMEKEGRGQHDLRIPLDALGEIFPPSCSISRRGDIAHCLLGNKGARGCHYASLFLSIGAETSTAEDR